MCGRKLCATSCCSSWRAMCPKDDLCKCCKIKRQTSFPSTPIGVIVKCDLHTMSDHGRFPSDKLKHCARLCAPDILSVLGVHVLTRHDHCQCVWRHGHTTERPPVRAQHPGEVREVHGSEQHVGSEIIDIGSSLANFIVPERPMSFVRQVWTPLVHSQFDV